MSRVAEPRERNQIRYVITPKIHFKALRDRGSFKASVLKELEGLGEEMDIKHMVRGYMDSFAVIHRKVRALLEGPVAQSEKILEDERTALEQKTQKNIVTWKAIEFTDEGKLSEELFIWDEFSKRRKWLGEKNAFENQFLKSYVSAEIDK